MKRLRALLCLGASLLIVDAAHARPAADPLAPSAQWSVNARGNAPLPPMGWNSWNAFGTDITEEKLMASAQALVDTGLAAKGYRYVDIDDGWWLKRRMPDGRVLVRTANFPSAVTPDGSTSFRPLTDRLHAMGFKAGIYSDIGRNSCGQVYAPQAPNQPQGTRDEREIGLYGHIAQDIDLYMREWRFDLIKVDGCGVRALPADAPRVVSGEFRALGPLIDYNTIARTDIPAVRALYQQVSDALSAARPDQDYVFSICLWGGADVRSWAKQTGNMSRTSEDISPNWERLLHNFDSSVRRELYAHPGAWNDPDMLYIGAGAFDMAHPVEARSHMSLWAMINAPLMIGFDMRKATPDLLAILGNPAIIALDQDPAGNQAVLAYDSDTVQVLVKTLANGEKGVAIFNRTGQPFDGVLTADHLKWRGDADITLTDLWSGEKITFRKDFTAHLAPHETRVFRASGLSAHPDALYLSEMPGRVNPAVDGIVEPEADPLIHRGTLPWSSTRGTGERPQYGGWGGARADATPYGQSLKIGSVTYASGIGVLANSRLEVRNDGFRHFSALVGIDASARSRQSPVSFAVYGDGRLLAKTKALPYGAAPQPINADITGVKIVELVARGKPRERFPDPVTWAQAMVSP